MKKFSFKDDVPVTVTITAEVEGDKAETIKAMVEVCAYELKRAYERNELQAYTTDQLLRDGMTIPVSILSIKDIELIDQIATEKYKQLELNV